MRLCVTNNLGMNEIIHCSMCVTVDLFEECHMATALWNIGTWSQFVAWWGESHDPCSLLRELGVGWYLGQIAKCRNDCQKGGFMDPSVHEMWGVGFLSILNPSIHTFTMFPLIRKCNEVITQESSGCNWQEIGEAVWRVGEWMPGRGHTDGCCVVAADPWPLSCSLKHGGFSQRKMSSSTIRAMPSLRAQTCEHIWWVKESKIDLLAQTKPGFSSVQWWEWTRSLKGSCCRALA